MITACNLFEIAEAKWYKDHSVAIDRHLGIIEAEIKAAAAQGKLRFQYIITDHDNVIEAVKYRLRREGRLSITDIYYIKHNGKSMPDNVIQIEWSR